MLEVHQLEQRYGDYKVLRGVDLAVGQGEFVALLGPNGHGKSTLLRTICGLQRAKAGRVLFEGTDISDLPVQRIVEMGLVYIPEQRNLFSEMTVLDNLRLGAFARRARKNVPNNLEFVFELFPRLRERQKQLARTLSGGEAQMLALGRGIMSNARFLAVDEPSLGLAPKLISQIFASLAAINARGIGVLLVEQNVAKTCEVAARVYLLEEGEVVLSCDACLALEDQRVRSTLLGT